MTLDLILRAATKADLATFVRNRGFQVQVDGVWTNVPGFEYCWWGGEGKVKTQLKTFQASADVDTVTATEFAFKAGHPIWMGAGVTAERDGVVIGTWDREQGPNSVFTRAAGETPVVGEFLDGYIPELLLSGVVAIARMSAQLFIDDELIPDEADPDKLEQWARSIVARAIHNNAVNGTMANGEIPYKEWDGVRMFKPSSVNTWLAAHGLPGHIWQGGNVY